MSDGTKARLDFLRHAGFDVEPDKRNIPHLLASGWSVKMVAETYGITTRTVHRYLARPAPCPGERCLTMTPGGRLCYFCARST